MVKPANRLYEFGAFSVDPVKRLLLRDGQSVRITPKAFEILLVLLEHQGTVLEKDDLMRTVWPDTAVEENNLTRNISALRKALGESPDQHQYVVTIPGRGYQFVADVKQMEDGGAELFVARRTRSRIVLEEEDTDETDALDNSRSRDAYEAQRATSDTRFAHRLTRSALSRFITISLAILAVAVLASAIVYLILSTTRRTPRFEKIRMSKLTNIGKVGDAVIAPDGKYVTYVVRGRGQQSLWIRNVASGSEVQIIPPSAVEYWGLAFSHDGSHIFYVRFEDSVGEGVLYQVPVLGGASKELIRNLGGQFALSPDGSSVAFIRADSNQSKTTLLVAVLDGGAERTLVTRSSPKSLLPGPAWSPDGKTIACMATSESSNLEVNLIEVKVADGSERLISDKSWPHGGRIAWLAGGNGLVMCAKQQAASPSQIWRISYPGGEATRITTDLTSYRTVSLTADSETCAAVQTERKSSLWISRNDAPTRPTQVSSGTANYYGVSWAPDGRLVYAADSLSTQDIWVMSQPNGPAVQLTSETGGNRFPVVSKDGRSVFFVSDRSGSFNIWRMDADGRNQNPLTTSGNQYYPQCSPDGRWLFYINFAGDPYLWRLSMEDGKAVQISNKLKNFPAISPDGKSIACFSQNDEIKATWSIAIVSCVSGETIRVFDIPTTVATSAGVHWLPDGKAITYADSRNGVSNVWKQPLDGIPPSQVTDFQSDQIFWFDWSPDGKLACARGSVTDDVVLINSSN